MEVPPLRETHLHLLDQRMQNYALFPEVSPQKPVAQRRRHDRELRAREGAGAWITSTPNITDDAAVEVLPPPLTQPLAKPEWPVARAGRRSDEVFDYCAGYGGKRDP